MGHIIIDLHSHNIWRALKWCHLCPLRNYMYLQWRTSSSTQKSFSIRVENFDLPKTSFDNLIDAQKSNVPKSNSKTAQSENLETNKLKPLENVVSEKGSEKDNSIFYSKNIRKNELNIQMLSDSLHKQIFKNYLKENAKVSEDIVIKAQEELKRHNLWQDETPHLPDVDLKLPKLEGTNIEEHFKIIGKQQSEPYKELLLDLIKSGIPECPTDWCLAEGWTMYKPGEKPMHIDCPLEDAIVFDVEVCKSIGEAPTIATAVSNTAWYSWVCSELPDNVNPVMKQHYTLKDFIPMESKQIDRGKPRVVVGHNVSYDRARIKEQYLMQNSGMRFIDTMSLHICIGGVTSYQKAMLKSKTVLPEENETWREFSSLNSLKEVYKLYCKSELSKESRNIFVEGTLQDIRSQFQQLMTYCARDVIATYKILQKLLVIFFERFPHPVTLAGMLEMGTAYLPVNNNWNKYLTDAQQTYEDMENEALFLLARKSDDACQLLHEQKYLKDLWMWDEDWSIQKLKLKASNISVRRKTSILKDDAESNKDSLDCEEEYDTLASKFKYLFDSKVNLPVRVPHLPGYPAWYRKLCEKPNSDEWAPGPRLITTNVRVTPKLLNLTWEGYPLHYLKGHGWGFLVADLNLDDNIETKIPFVDLKKLTLKLSAKIPVYKNNVEHVGNGETDVHDYISKNEYWSTTVNFNNLPYKGTGIWCDQIIDNCCYFLKLPHKDGISKNVGNPLARDFLKTFNSSVLSGSDLAATKVLEIGRMLSYWRNNCDRICGQLVVWLNRKELPKTVNNECLNDLENYGAILPQVVVCGTLTRRAMEPTWMTASNALKERIGSELRSMVQAPPGYNIVGADVDSQELWIASMIGDAYFAKLHGATPFGWMTLRGHKSNETDMHSVTAKATGISRDHAKVINYARIYGAGTRFAQRLLKQFNPSMSDTEAKIKATKMFLLTKGKKCYKLKKQIDGVEDYCTSFSALKVAKQFGKPVDELFERPLWVGGTESAMFNRLEEIATSKKPVTPFLEGRLSRALEPRFENDDSYLTTKVNWVVQSGAVDFLHLMLVCMRWLTNGQARFCLSFHDEVRYLVASDKKYNAALALHITNLLTRSFCAQRLGLYDLPMSVAFFTSVEVDTILRKEADHDCVTPSNPHGIMKGYNILPGESLNIYETIKKTNGSLGVFKNKINKRCQDAMNYYVQVVNF